MPGADLVLSHSSAFQPGFNIQTSVPVLNMGTQLLTNIFSGHRGPFQEKDEVTIQPGGPSKSVN